ncbi:MAG: DNA-binding protein, partial [Proteobacteria bacterium]|nr:DNA-binding protein [Pseudomonadota bacterium]
LEALRGIYFDKDPFTTVERDKDGAMLVEHNCPYLTAAMDEPRLCSVTISTMKRLLGVDVERTQRFQQGDGRCVFRIRENQAVPKRFRFDWEDKS